MSKLVLEEAWVFNTDKRGWVVDPILREDFRETVPQNIHLVSVEPGTVRGNHYHQDKNEYICLVGSRARIAVVDRASGTREEIEVSLEKPLIFKALPNSIHAVKNIGDDILFLFCYSDKPYDAEHPDVVKVTILE